MMLLAGCGGAGSGESSTTGAASFSVQARTLCQDFRKRVAGAVANVPQVDEANPQPEQVKAATAAAAETVLPLVRSTLARLRKLEPPADRVAKWQSFLHNIDAFVSTSAKNLDSLRESGDVAEYRRAIGERDDLIERVDVSAIVAGVPACAFL
ncbi:MAG TPA: hypothetical protein VGJ34_06305 [Gaiellaceae bacterium]|jgi:hypothetical protein